ncbi:autophagy-related protein [Plectosphaerella plurivora]|uniref:Autophagy-related protein 101 n=1 Tax=Plectosphaerella plurivora TaxID=936078 RepID=A0A9P9A5F8_9PEZI|nr:autophagy-related protein [Plectosphaerella plurivora]
MDQATTPEFILEAFADPNSVRDVVRGILHTIFFHRWFPALTPRTRDVLDLTLPHVDDVELETLIEQRTTALLRQLESSPDQTQQSPIATQQYTSSFARGAGNTSSGATTPGGGRGQVTVQFFEKKRRKAWIMSRGDEEVCWESWTVRVTVAEPRTESERAKVRRAMEQTLLTAVMKIVTHANVHKDHIPPITAQGTNPFPYQINVNQKESGGWATRMGIY